MHLAVTENSCVNFQTLRSGVRITTSTDVSLGVAAVNPPRSCGLLRVFLHPLEIDDHDILVSNHPGITPGRQERHLARFA